MYLNQDDLRGAVVQVRAWDFIKMYLNWDDFSYAPLFIIMHVKYMNDEV